MGVSLYLRIGTRTEHYLIVRECVCGALWWWRIRIPAFFTSKMRVSLIPFWKCCTLNPHALKLAVYNKVKYKLFSFKMPKFFFKYSKQQAVKLRVFPAKCNHTSLFHKMLFNKTEGFCFF